MTQKQLIRERAQKVKLAAVNIKMISDNQLLRNLDKLHTTKLGRIRIEHNLSLTNRDVIAFCKEKILNPEAIMNRKGKNWYVKIDHIIVTINANSFTVITAHTEGEHFKIVETKQILSVCLRRRLLFQRK